MPTRSISRAGGASICAKPWAPPPAAAGPNCAVSTICWALPATQGELLEALARFGLPVSSERRVVRGAGGLAAFYEHVQAMRADLPFEIDGVVYKVDSLEIQRRLGFRTTADRRATTAGVRSQRWQRDES